MIIICIEKKNIYKKKLTILGIVAFHSNLLLLLLFFFTSPKKRNLICTEYCFFFNIAIVLVRVL